tara:strand:- start:43 stop:627 length:585 start_codon:yes stop_codon:yes gene_type:complete
MRIFLKILILITIFQSFTKADNISEFEIEGISIGDSLLKKFSLNDIIDKIKNQKQHYNNNDFLLISFSIESQKYDALRFHIKKNDKNYLAHHIGGYKFLDFNQCKNMKNKISDDLSEIFGSSKRQDAKMKNHSYDKTGESKTISNYFNLKSGRIRIMCTDWSSTLTAEKNWQDNLQVNIYSKEFSNWLNNKAYK